MFTAICEVRGSYPAPPDAKQTPVMRSLGWICGSRYAGRSSLIPNTSTDDKINKSHIFNYSLTCDKYFIKFYTVEGLPCLTYLESQMELFHCRTDRSGHHL